VTTAMPGRCDLLRSMFDAAMAAALPARIVPAHLPAPPKGRTVVVGAGKASLPVLLAHGAGHRAPVGRGEMSRPAPRQPRLRSLWL
jgi:glycerate-2-kinase